MEPNDPTLPEANKPVPPAVPVLHKSKKATESPECVGCEYSVRLTRAHDDFICTHPAATYEYAQGRKVHTSQSVFLATTCKGLLRKDAGT